MYVKQTQDEVANVATAGGKATKQVKLSVQQVHKELGHINERAIKKWPRIWAGNLWTINC